MANSIDYGMEKTNIDHDTGIRYGVISIHEVTQAWCDSSEPYYGEPTCPKCGNEVTEDHETDYTNELWYKHNKDHFCPDCEYCFDSDYAYDDEPLSHKLDDGEYVATRGSDDSDIFVIKSPYYTLCEYCSPCAPGAGYLLNEGSVKAYCFGHDWFEDNKAPYKVYSVATGKEVISEKDKLNETLQKYIMENGKVQSYAFPGGYPIYYLTADNGVLCPDCVNKNMKLLNDKNDKQWYVIAAEINYEDDSLCCDNCYKQIESAYGEPKTEKE